MKHLDGIVARGTVYSVAAGDVQRVDLETLSGLIGGLADLTGESVTPNDLLEVIEEPVDEMDLETRAWQNSDLSQLGKVAPYDWGSTDPKTLGVAVVKGVIRK